MQDNELRERLVRVETKVDDIEKRQDNVDKRFDAIEMKLDDLKQLITDRSGFVKGALWLAGGVGALFAFGWDWIRSHWTW